MGKRQLLQYTVWENWTATCKRIKLDYFTMPYTKVNLKWIKNLNVRTYTVKLLEENMHYTFWHWSQSYYFYVSSDKGVFPGGSDDKESACSVGNPGLIPGSGRSPGEIHSNPLQYSCLENSMGSGAWWATVYGVTELDMTEQ